MEWAYGIDSVLGNLALDEMFRVIVDGWFVVVYAIDW